jgi:hypothetical protein
VALLNHRIGNVAAARLFIRRFPEFCPEGGFPLAVREDIENAWRQPTAFDRDAALLEPIASALHFYGIAVDRQEAGAEAWAYLAAVIWYATKISDRMRVCANPDCRARYFVASKRIQKYCSKACAAPAQRALKRTWWKEHGPKWRAKWRAEHKPKPKVKRTARKGQRKRKEGK